MGLPIETTTDAPPPLVSIVMVTFARDAIAARAVAQAAEAVGGRDDVEFILVDNNPDAIDRSGLCAPFARSRVIKIGFNKGVSSRNDGLTAAHGQFVLCLDDDAFLTPVGALDHYLAAFAADPKLAIVGARHIDHRSGDTPRDCFPHTDKSLPKDRAFKTFRFQGNGFCVRAKALREIGPMTTDFFYGIEEIDYAYRVIDAGWHILYEPAVRIVEYNDPGGRLPDRRVQEMRLTNKLIISWKYMPAIHLPVNLLLFTAYVFWLNRGRLNIVRAWREFLGWVRANPGGRRPIGPAARAYVLACGGVLWK